MDAAMMGKEVKVFDFYGLHIFLNIEDIQRYQRTRAIHYNPQALLDQRWQGYGARSSLQELMRGLKSRGANEAA